MELAAIVEGFGATFLPLSELSVAEWASKYRTLPGSGSSAPGPWRNDRTPYLVEIMNELSPQSRSKEVVFCKGSQIGATEAGTNWILYSMDVQPGPFLAVQPTEGDALKWSKMRVTPSIDSCDRIAAKVPKGRRSGASFLQKDYRGGTLIISGANSPSALASMPIGNLYLDEIDRYPLDVGDEGDPLDLVKRRISTFPRAKTLYTSTPTLLITSKVWRLYQESDRRIYKVPCPYCGFYQEIIFEQIRWDKGKPETASMYCRECGVEIKEYHKTRMLAAGMWEAQNPGHWRVGFHLSSLYSPLGWLSWSEIAKGFEEVGNDPEKRKTFQNTILGLPWEDDGESLAVDIFDRRKESYPGQVPEDVLMLTLAVDVQQARLEYEVRGWGQDEESWGIEYGILRGDPAELRGVDDASPSVWQQLDEVRQAVYQRSDGLALRIACTTVDSGGLYTDTVYAYTKARERLRVFSVKGSSVSSRPIMSKATRNTKNRCALFMVGVDKAKELLYARLRINEPGPGYMHFPDDERSGYTGAYYAGLTCERRVVRYVRGYRVMEWEKPRDARNEPTDIFVYGLAAIRIINPNWRTIAARMSGAKRLTSDRAKPVTYQSPPLVNRYQEGISF